MATSALHYIPISGSLILPLGNHPVDLHLASSPDNHRLLPSLFLQQSPPKVLNFPIQSLHIGAILVGKFLSCIAFEPLVPCDKQMHGSNFHVQSTRVFYCSRRRGARVGCIVRSEEMVLCELTLEPQRFHRRHKLCVLGRCMKIDEMSQVWRFIAL